MPTISTGSGSDSPPASTVHAVPCIPGFRSASLKISTLPALGRTGAGSWARTTKEHANATTSAADFGMKPSFNYNQPSILLSAFELFDVKHRSAVPIMNQIRGGASLRLVESKPEA